MEPELPLKSVVVFIACGTMVFIIVFIFAKRQITRYALKSRGPHVAVGSDAPKALRQEIERRLKRVADIQYEPRLLSEQSEHASSTPEACRFLYRMKAVDALALLDTELMSFLPAVRRSSGLNLRTFLLEQRQVGCPLEAIELNTINKFTDLYDHARHEPAEFQQVQYQEYMDCLNQMIQHVKNKKNKKRELQLEEDVKNESDVTTGGAGEVDELGEEVIPPLASPDQTIEEARPATELDHDDEDDDDDDDDDDDTDVQVTYKPLKDENITTGSMRLDAGGGSGSLDGIPGDQGSDQLDQGDQISLCSGSSRSSSHLETQV